MADRPYVCSKCLRPYTRKAYFDAHFDKPRAKSGGPNPCYSSQIRTYGRSVDEAKELQKVPSIGQLAVRKRVSGDETSSFTAKRSNVSCDVDDSVQLHHSKTLTDDIEMTTVSQAIPGASSTYLGEVKDIQEFLQPGIPTDALTMPGDSQVVTTEPVNENATFANQ